ncbi:hypothetical protein Taro_011770 [Colocasia esculenta]|uniref:Uncharacterized protein n=1 Tax=Colocasia esculenta TaxID=4460 RepID=A0A843U738_COLES|nr:hypothetical protein [Colocasia esculenta]
MASRTLISFCRSSAWRAPDAPKAVRPPPPKPVGWFTAVAVAEELARSNDAGRSWSFVHGMGGGSYQAFKNSSKNLLTDRDWDS